MLKKLIENLFRPSYVEFSSEEEMLDFTVARPDLWLAPGEGGNANHLYYKVTWRLPQLSRH
jgi:hypothetical protein